MVLIESVCSKKSSENIKQIVKGKIDIQETSKYDDIHYTYMIYTLICQGKRLVHKHFTFVHTGFYPTYQSLYPTMQYLKSLHSVLITFPSQKSKPIHAKSLTKPEKLRILYFHFS